MLDRIRTDGDWEAWLDFFLEGVRATAVGAVTTAQRLVEFFKATLSAFRAAAVRPVRPCAYTPRCANGR